VKIRVGYGLGNLRSLDGARLGSLAEAIEHHGFDSLWLSERISGPAPDPVLGLTFAAARTSKIKLGTSVQVLPGRSPARVAKSWATLDALSGGRALPAFGLGIAHPVEQQAFGVERGERAPIFDEALPLIRRLWSEDAVDHDGKYFHYEGMTVLPKPSKPLDVWLGGKAPSELRRVGKLADGWLASFSTPEDCKAGRDAIEAATAAAGRSIDDDHYGAMVFYTHDQIPERIMEMLASRNPGADPADLVARGWPAVRELCERYVAVGFSKLVLVPFTEPGDWDEELAHGAQEVLPIQN
jgi:probable F420-dependent oxidoreductase